VAGAAQGDGRDPQPAGAGRDVLLEWASYRSAHRLVGLSPGIVEGIARRGVPRERITLVPNGCDLEIFGGEVVPWRPEAVKPTDLLAAFTGTHGMANGLDAVLDAAAVLKRRGRDDIKILLIGQGKLKPALQARAEREGLWNVVFHDPVNKARLAGLMAGTDVGMQILANVPAFYYGTSPNKFFDYIAAGLPVLNNYPGWLAGMIEEHRCGFAVPPDNPNAFADALEKAADDREALKEMGAARQGAGDPRVRPPEAGRPLGGLGGGRAAMIKRAFDIVASAIGLLLLAPVIAVLAWQIRKKLGSPVIFRQTRPGLHGEPFQMVKFRTMRDAIGADGQPLPDSERMTPFGSFLRSASLDELPELWNVLKGDMSLVGPRPLLMEYLPLYSPEQARRHEVRPGVTGWAQINGRNALSWEEKFAWTCGTWTTSRSGWT
jgi:lipopolysaccharide/colanic/teichoic acid biosynthesis glycosyltransferase